MPWHLSLYGLWGFLAMIICAVALIVTILLEGTQPGGFVNHPHAWICGRDRLKADWRLALEAQWSIERTPSRHSRATSTTNGLGLDWGAGPCYVVSRFFIHVAHKQTKTVPTRDPSSYIRGNLGPTHPSTPTLGVESIRRAGDSASEASDGTRAAPSTLISILHWPPILW